MSTMMVNPLAAPPDTGATVNSPANAAASANAASTSSGAPSADSLSTEFLQLLIAQLQNQDPENPTDGTTFVTQLATFTGVQEQTQSTSDLGSILSLMQQAAAPTPVAAAANGTISHGGSPQAGTA